MDKVIEYHAVKSVSDNVIRKEGTLYRSMWSTFKEECNHMICERKENAPLFGFYKFDFDRSDIVERKKDYVKTITAICLDYDDGKEIDEVLEEIKGLEFVLYTTHSHSSKLHKFRTILPLKDDYVTQDDLENRKESLLARFEGLDKSTFDRCRFFYIPSCRNSDKNFARIERGSGDLFDLYSYEARKKEYVVSRGNKNKKITNKDVMLAIMCIQKFPNQISYGDWRDFVMGMASTQSEQVLNEMLKKWDDSKSKHTISTIWKNWNSELKKNLGLGSSFFLFKKYKGEILFDYLRDYANES